MSAEPVTDVAELIRGCVRDIPDYPKPGVTFKDITPLLGDPAAFRAVIDAIVADWHDADVEQVVGIEARGFIVAAPVAYGLGAGFVPVRKAGKLPAATYAQRYELEYGTETVEVHQDGFHRGDRVLIVDDVLATGGTARATADLVGKAGGRVAGFAALLELSFLGGRARIDDFPARVQLVV